MNFMIYGMCVYVYRYHEGKEQLLVAAHVKPSNKDPPRSAQVCMCM